MMRVMKATSSSHKTSIRVKKRRGDWLVVQLLRGSRWDFTAGLNMLLLFCLGSVLWQIHGAAPRIIHNYYGKSTFVDDNGLLPRRESISKAHLDLAMFAYSFLQKRSKSVRLRGHLQCTALFRSPHRFSIKKVLPFPSQVIYNRVGKCGSRTIVLLLRILAERHHFTLISSDVHKKTRLTKREQMDLINSLSRFPQPFLYTQHVHFLNFTRFGIAEPVYINIIRDPVNRFLSNYFFRRFGDWRGVENDVIRNPEMKSDERYLDINTCILESYPECTNPRLFYIIPYFCGQSYLCRKPSLWALRKAKENVLEHYLLVGVLEELEDVLRLLERLLPHFFSDAPKIYKSPEYKKLGNMTVTVHKNTPSPEALQVLYQRMKYEYDFYRFVKAQFHLTKRKFGLRT